MTRMRILLADDHPLYRAGLRVLLEGQPDTLDVGEACNGDEAIALVEQTAPDLVLMDVSMPGTNGIEATRQITMRHPDVAVLVLTMLEDGPTVLAAVRAGARGYLVKGAGGDEALGAIRAVVRGDIIIGADVATEVLLRIDAGTDPSKLAPFCGLTDREREILALIAEGYTNAAIAQRIHLSAKTVRNYVSAIFRKLQVGNRVDAVIRARDAGLG